MSLSTGNPFFITPENCSSEPLCAWNMEVNACAPVAFEHSIAAMSTVLHAVVDDRVSRGDELLLHAFHARKNGEFDVAAAASASVAPHKSVRGFERAFYSAQFTDAFAPNAISVFDIPAIPGLSPHVILARLLSVEDCVSYSVYLKMVILLDRALFNNPGLFLNSTNFQGLLVAAFMVASKSDERINLSNSQYAALGLVSAEDANRVESALLEALHGSTSVTKNELQSFADCIIQEAVDSSWGLHVLVALQKDDVLKLDSIVHGTRTWLTIDTHLSTISNVRESSRLAAGWKRAQARRKVLEKALGPSRDIVAGIAMAIAAHNFPNIDLFATTCDGRLAQREAVGVYSFTARRRFKYLQWMAGDAACGLTKIPSLYLCHVMPLEQLSSVLDLVGPGVQGGQAGAVNAKNFFHLASRTPSPCSVHGLEWMVTQLVD